MNMTSMSQLSTKLFSVQLRPALMKCENLFNFGQQSPDIQRIAITSFDDEKLMYTILLIVSIT